MWYQKEPAWQVLGAIQLIWDWTGDTSWGHTQALKQGKILEFVIVYVAVKCLRSYLSYYFIKSEDKNCLYVYLC